jgi:hypothetical protein
MFFPLMVGVTPGVPEDEEDEGEVSTPDDELIVELMVFFTAPVAISFRGMDLGVLFESSLEIGNGELFDSMEGLDSTSSLDLDSWEDREVPVFSALSICLGESILEGISLRDVGVAAR